MINLKSEAIERFKHSVWIQKLSSTTYTEDVNHLAGKGLPSNLGHSNGNPNAWRAKVSRKGDWVYFKTLAELLVWLENNCR